MTVEVKIITATKDIPAWLRSIADFTETIKKTEQARELYVKISQDC